MFLIIDRVQTTFHIHLQRVLEAKGVATLFLSEAAIARELSLQFHLTVSEGFFYINFQGNIIRSAEIDGVYCGLDTFSPELWNYFTEEDARYAAQECHSLWLAMLTVLGNKVIHQPAPESLAGTALSSNEFLYQAYLVGLRIPMVMILESGMVAAQLVESGAALIVTDPAEVWNEELYYGPEGISKLQGMTYPVQVREHLGGEQVSIAICGKLTFFVIRNGREQFKPLNPKTVPPDIRQGLARLTRKLNLNFVEYYFTVLSNHTWVVTGMNRFAPQAYSVYGNQVLHGIVDFILGEVD